MNAASQLDSSDAWSRERTKFHPQDCVVVMGKWKQIMEIVRVWFCRFIRPQITYDLGFIGFPAKQDWQRESPIFDGISAFRGSNLSPIGMLHGHATLCYNINPWSFVLYFVTNASVSDGVSLPYSFRSFTSRSREQSMSDKGNERGQCSIPVGKYTFRLQ